MSQLTLNFSSETLRVSAQAMQNDRKRREDFARTHTRSTDPESSAKAAERISLHADSQCGRLRDKLREGPIAAGALYAWALEQTPPIRNVKARCSDLRGWGYTVKYDEASDTYSLLEQS